MSIDLDEDTEQHARVARMIDEFRQAQSRRSAKLNVNVAGSKPDAETNAPLAGSVASEDTALRPE
jgi:hypothetical protein